MRKEITRPPIKSLACVESECELYGVRDAGNLTVRKVYGKEQIRYLRCTKCGSEFSERKQTALWNTKVSESRAVSVAEHLSEGCSLESTARLAKVDISVVERLNKVIGKHGRAFHEAHVQNVEVEALQADERHGFSESKGQAAWEAEVIDPKSKLILAHEQGARDESLIRRLYAETTKRLANRHNLTLFTDGEHSYASLFAEYFGVAYQPSRKGSKGRRPKIRYRIPRSLAHVQIVKRREGARVVEVDIRFTHGSRKRAQKSLVALGYATPNTSAIERRNGTARRMSAYQVRKSIAFSRRPDVKRNLAWWGITVYNWCRRHRSLRSPFDMPCGKKSTSSVLPPWLLAWLTIFSQFARSCSPLSISNSSADNLTELPKYLTIDHVN